jgi:hypothetical protein
VRENETENGMYNVLSSSLIKWQKKGLGQMIHKMLSYKRRLGRGDLRFEVD